MYKYSCDLAKSVDDRVNDLKTSKNWMTWKRFTRFVVRYYLIHGVKNNSRFLHKISSRDFFSFLWLSRGQQVNHEFKFVSQSNIRIHVYVYSRIPCTHTYVYGFILRFGFSYRCPINLSTLIIISVSYRRTNGPIKATEKLMPGPAEWGLMLIKNKL